MTFKYSQQRYEPNILTDTWRVVKKKSFSEANSMYTEQRLKHHGPRIREILVLFFRSIWFGHSDLPNIATVLVHIEKIFNVPKKYFPKKTEYELHTVEKVGQGLTGYQLHIFAALALATLAK